MCEWKYECLALNSTVKPVYNGQSQGITKMSFVWEHIYTVNAFEYVAVSALTVGHTTHYPTHESRLQVLHKHNLWYSMSAFTSLKSSFLRLKTAT